ncbi:MAG: hypothetical protein GQ564_15420 [Bacteroidales bacterium]|nr:hypothetical protein [Bacteroidales bacterium]
MQKLEDFYRKKTDQELFRILKENNAYKQKLLAESILKERKFEFDNLEKYKVTWELENLEKEIKEENDNVISWFRNWIFGFDIFTVLPVFLMLIIILVFGNLIFQLLNLVEKTIIETVLSLCVLVVFEFILLHIYETRKKNTNKRAARITELKKKIL